MFLKSKKSSSTILLCLMALNASATQFVTEAEKKHVEVNISANEQNRLAIEGGRIVNVVPSQKGVLTYQKDEALGALYFSLASDSPNQGTVTMFVSDDRGLTYKLILVPRPIAGEEIILQPPKEKGGRANPTASTSDRRHAASYQRRVKDLVLIMADEELKDAVDMEQVNKEVPLWKEGRLVLKAKYLDGDIVGEKYDLTNISNSEMLLVEQELYRNGVIGVSIEHQTLMPGESTNLFIVRERKDNE